MKLKNHFYFCLFEIFMILDLSSAHAYHVVIILTGHGLDPGVAYPQYAYLYCRLVFINTVKRALQYIPSWGENEENTLNNKVIKIRTQNKLTSCVAQWIKSLLHNLTIISW